MTDRKTAPHFYRTHLKEGEIVPEHLKAMYEFIESYKKEFGYPPTNREMVENDFAGSTSVVRYYYDLMAEYNMLERIPTISRGIRLIPRHKWGRKPPKIQIEKEPEHVYA